MVMKKFLGLLNLEEKGDKETIYEEIAVIKDREDYRVNAYSSSQFFKKTRSY